MRQSAYGIGFCVIVACVCPMGINGASFLFDASLNETASNADWVIDADSQSGSDSRASRYPTPDQCDVSAGTQETHWDGAISAWGIELVQDGHHVESLPVNTLITYGSCTNPQDLSHYDVFVLPEPQNPLRPSVKSAILSFVQAGGGLFLIANHHGSDRDNDGFDSGQALSPLTREFGFEYGEDAFYQQHNNNAANLPDDPVLHGRFGDAGYITLFNANTMRLTSVVPEVTLVPLIWQNGVAHDTTKITVLRAEVLNGRVVALTDSSPVDDGTGDPDDALENGWIYNRRLIMNASIWLAEREPALQYTACPGSTPTPGCGTVPPTSTPTPAPSPTAQPPSITVVVNTNQTVFACDDQFLLTTRVINVGGACVSDFYVVLDVPVGASSLYYFYPGWTMDLDSWPRTFTANADVTNDILNFIWPCVDVQGTAAFWAIVANAGTYEVLGLSQTFFSF